MDPEYPDLLKEAAGQTDEIDPSDMIIDAEELCTNIVFFFFFSSHLFAPARESSQPSPPHHSRSASRSPKGISAPSPASRVLTGSSSRDCAWARMAASPARAVHRRVSARAAAICAQGARTRLRTRARRRMKASVPLLKRPPTSRPNTTRRQRPRPPG